MEIDLTTLVLEIVNFLILVWLLKRFLYQPVLRVVRQRQQDIQGRLQEAENARNEAEQVRRDYQARLDSIEAEMREARQRLEEDLQARRDKALKEVRVAAEREDEKLRSARQNKDDQWRRETEQQSLLLATRFVTRMLQVVADEYLHRRLTDFAITSLERLDDSDLARLRATLDTDTPITVHCAFALDDSQRRALTDWAGRHLGLSSPVDCNADRRLIAGIRLAIGSWSLGFNLADELRGFTDCIHGSYGQSPEPVGPGEGESALPGDGEVQPNHGP